MDEATPITISDPNSEFVAKYPNGLTLDDLLPFYEEVAQNKPIQLEWKFPGRIKRPSPQDLETKRDEASANNDQQEKRGDGTGVSDNQKQQQLNFAEFDFDTETSVETADFAATQRRPLGGSARPIREKRVARLDKILQEDMVRRRLELEHLRQQQQQAGVQQSQSPKRIVIGDGDGKESNAPTDVEVTPPQPVSSAPESQPMDTQDLCPISTNLPTRISEMVIANENDMTSTNSNTT